MHLIDKPFDSHRTSRRSLIVGLSAAAMAAAAAASAAATGLPRGRSDETGDGSRGIACGQGAVSLSRSEAGELSSSDSITVSRPGLGSVAMDFDGDAGVESGARAAWTGAPSAARLRLSRATPDAGGATHFMLIPYRYGMALEYPGVLEAWVAEFSVHNHVNAIADSGARMWVGNHNDTGGLRMTAHRRDGVMYAELSSELFDRSSGGDMRFVVRRPPDDHWSFMSGGLSAEREVARIGGEGDVTARVASAARVVVGAIGPGGRAGIVFGANGDTGIYRAAADVLRTDDNLQAQGDVIANAGQHGQIQMGAAGQSARILFGPSADVALMHRSAGVLGVDGMLVVDRGLGVGNSTNASTPGTVVRKIEVFDVNGVRIGFLPVYSSIS